MTSICFQKTYQRSFGTYPLKGAELTAALQAAVAVGYRSIDTAQMYGNEADVGAALSRLSLPREELCITTKVDPGNYTDEKFLPSVRQSLRDLGLEQVDVLLLHWPPRDGEVAAPLKLLAQARAEGLTRHIGVSNFTAAMMREARDLSADPLVTNQVEFHPLAEPGCSAGRRDRNRHPALLLLLGRAGRGLQIPAVSGACGRNTARRRLR